MFYEASTFLIKLSQGILTPEIRDLCTCATERKRQDERKLNEDYISRGGDTERVNFEDFLNMNFNDICIKLTYQSSVRDEHSLPYVVHFVDISTNFYTTQIIYLLFFTI